MKTNNIAIGILGGIAAGAILGILFAPAKGKDTRKQIAKKSNDYASELKDKFGDIMETITDKYEQMRHNGEELVATGKSKFEENKKELKNMTV